MKEKFNRLMQREYAPVIAAFALLVIFKLCVILPIATGPISFGDEALYKKFSLQWFTLGRQLETHYPPIYPLLLAPSFLFKSHWYLAMRVFNILYSSLVPVFFYLISRLYMGQKNSIYCMIIGCVVPFHFIMPTMILSENIFFPLLLLEIYLVLREYPKHPVMGDILIGFFLAVLCLARYISIVTIPVFALVWLMKELNLKNKFVGLIGRGCLIVAVMGLTYLPWILLNYKDVPFKEIIGFGIASKTNPEQLTMHRLLLTAVLYICYFLLLALPVLPTLLGSLGQLDYRRPVSRYNQIWVLIVGLAGAFFVAVTRHSWRVSYNWPVFSRIMGRYLMCFPLLFVALAFVTWEKRHGRQKETGLADYSDRGQKETGLADYSDRGRKEADSDYDGADSVTQVTGPEHGVGEKRFDKKGLVITVILSLCSMVLIALSYYADIAGALYQGSAEQFLNFKGSMEGYKFVVLKVPYLVFGLIVMLAVHFVGFTGWRRHAFFVLFIGILLFEVAGMDKYVGHMNRYRQEKGADAITEMNRLLAEEFPPVTETLSPWENLTPLYYDLSGKATGANWEKWCLKFFCNQYYVKIVDNTDKIEAGEKYYVVTETPQDYESSRVIKTIGSFERKGITNTLMLVTK